MLKTLSEKFLTNASRLEFIICMLSIKTKALLIAKAMCFSKPFGITLIYVSNLFIYQMTVIAFQIMKYYRIIAFLVNLRLILQFQWVERLCFLDA